MSGAELARFLFKRLIDFLALLFCWYMLYDLLLRLYCLFKARAAARKLLPQMAPIKRKGPISYSAAGRPQKNTKAAAPKPRRLPRLKTGYSVALFWLLPLPAALLMHTLSTPWQLPSLPAHYFGEMWFSYGFRFIDEQSLSLFPARLTAVYGYLLSFYLLLKALPSGNGTGYSSDTDGFSGSSDWGSGSSSSGSDSDWRAA